MRARPAHGERERPGALGSVRGALDRTQTQQTDNSIPSALLRPPSGYSVNRLLGPGDGRRESGTGRKSWPPRSRFPSLVSYRLDHIDWKPEGSNLWTQGYWKREPHPHPALASGQGSGPVHLRTTSLSISRLQSKKAPEGIKS